MNYALEERIGNPDLFTGRKEELAYFLKWISDVKERKSMSTAIFGKAIEIAKQEGLSYLCGIIEDAAHAVAHEKIDILWNIVREAPLRPCWFRAVGWAG